MTHPARALRLAVSLLAVFAVMFSGPADAQSRKKKTKAAAEQPVEPPVLQVPLGTRTKGVQVERIAVRIPSNTIIGKIGEGLFCSKIDDYRLRGGAYSLDDPAYIDRLRTEMASAGYTLVGDPNALFKDRDQSKAELLVGGVLADIKADLCIPSETAIFRLGGGTAEVLIDWQLYDALNRRVVYQRQIRGTSKIESSKNGEERVLIEAYASAVRLLLADRNFYELVVGEPPPGAATVATAAPLAPVAPSAPATLISRLPLSQRAFQDQAVEIRGNVATIFAGAGQGSGFFVSDRHVITNAHVVGAAKFVKVRLITGREILGDVLTADEARDVALIQTETAGFPGLPVREDEAAIGSGVFAIGSPLDEKNEGTVSAGVISSYRTEDNLRLIQSDVNVMPGNSGGPLLDDKGNVLGLTVSGQMNAAGGSMGLNYFIPITDAMARLGLQFR